MVNDYGKLILLLVSMILGSAVAVVLILSDNVAAGTGIFGSTVGVSVGYLTGNGVLAAKGNAPSPVYTPKPERVKETMNDNH